MIGSNDRSRIGAARSLGYRNPHWVSDFLCEKEKMRRYAPVRSLIEKKRCGSALIA
jgi:hypothetical protein